MVTTRYNKYINYICCIIPAFILIIPAAGEVAFVILMICSLIYCYQQKINPFVCPSSKGVAIACSIYFAIALLSILASDSSVYAFKRLGTNFHFLVAPWLAVLLSQQLNKQMLSYAIKTGAVLAGVIALVQYFYLDMRAHGTVNAIPFGDVVLLLSFFSIINIYHETGKQKWFSFFAFILGFCAVIFSLSRGAWVTIPFLFILTLFIWYKQQIISAKLLSTFSIISIVVIVGLSMLPQVQSRFEEVQKNIASYEENSLTSIGMRITLWKTAIKAIPTHPVLGFGLHNTKQVISDFIDDNTLKARLLGFGHFHNEYLTTLVGKGFVGLISLLVLLIAPCILFYRYVPFLETNYLSSLVLLLCTGYAFFGLTNLAFGHGIMNTFFVFMLTASTQLLAIQVKS